MITNYLRNILKNCSERLIVSYVLIVIAILLVGCSVTTKGNLNENIPWKTHLFNKERTNSTNQGIDLPIKRYWNFGLWSFSELFLPYNPIRSSSPVITDSVIYIGNGNKKLYALDLIKRKVLWRFDTSGHIETSPTLNEEAVFFGTGDGIIYSLDRISGKELWRFQAKAEILSSPLIMEDTVYFASTDNRLYGLDYKTGETKWQHGRISAKSVGSRIFASPAGTDGRIYHLFSDGYLLCLDVSSGRELWKRRIVDTSIMRYRRGRRTPSIFKDMVYVLDSDGAVLELDGKSGKEIRKFNLIRADDFLVADGKMFLINVDRVVAIDINTDDMIWEKRVGNALSLSIFRAGEYIFILSNRHYKPFGIDLFSKKKGYIEALKISDGQRAFDDEIDTTITANGIVYNNHLLLVADAGFLVIYGQRK